MAFVSHYRGSSIEKIAHTKPPKGWHEVANPDKLGFPGSPLVGWERDDGGLQAGIDVVPDDGGGSALEFATWGPNGEWNYDNESGYFTRQRDALRFARGWMRGHT